jgi:hypothetical protein
MTTEIAKTEVDNNGFAGVPSIPSKFENDFGAFTSALFLPRLSLEGSNSQNAKHKKIAAGNYALITGRDTFEDLGDRVDLLVLTYRPKALDLSDKKNIISSYDKDSPTFKGIVEKASVKTQEKKGYMYGLEFLVYIPGAKNDLKFATFFCGNPTHRVAAKNFAPILKSHAKTATLKVEIIDNGSYVWEGPVVIICNTPLPNYPTVEEMTMQMQTFLNPTEDDIVETATDEEAGSTSRER